MSKQPSDLEYLIELTEDSIPTFIRELPTHEQKELRGYIESIVKRDETGLDKLFESMSMMMKFIPNFILHSLTPKYIEPSIAARITNKLTVKQALGVTVGLPIEYIGETSIYLESQHAANILVGLKQKMVKPVLEYVNNKHPLKGLDILEHVPNGFLQIAVPIIDPSSFDKTNVTSGRRDVLTRIEQLAR